MPLILLVVTTILKALYCRAAAQEKCCAWVASQLKAGIQMRSCLIMHPQRGVGMRSRFLH